MHAACIAAKRLHYLVEPLVTGKEVVTVLKPLKMRQDRLGLCMTGACWHGIWIGH